MASDVDGAGEADNRPVAIFLIDDDLAARFRPAPDFCGLNAFAIAMDEHEKIEVVREGDRLFRLRAISEDRLAPRRLVLQPMKD